MMGTTIKHHLTIVQNPGAILTHLVDSQDALNAGATVGPGMNEIGVAVVIPKRTGIDPTLGASNQKWRRPRTGRIASLGQVDSIVRIGKENIEIALVIADCGRPNTIAVLGLGEDVPWSLVLEGVGDDAPVDEISGVENRETRSGIEARRSQVEIAANSNDVRIRIVSIDDGVLVGAIAVVRHPN